MDSSDYFELHLVEDTCKHGVEMPKEFEAILGSDPEAPKYSNHLPVE